MNADIQSYVEEVCRNLPKHVNRADVTAELRAHLEESVLERCGQGMDAGAAVKAALEHMGDPVKLGRAYNGTRPLPAVLWSGVLLLANALCLGAGLVLLAGLRAGSASATYGFQMLAAGKVWVLLGYGLMWVLSGFMLGRKYGAHAEKRIHRMILPPLLPNYLFMLLVLFGILPSEWFDSLLSLPFVLMCIASTFLFSHLARLGCRWGRHASLHVE